MEGQSSQPRESRAGAQAGSTRSTRQLMHLLPSPALGCISCSQPLQGRRGTLQNLLCSSLLQHERCHQLNLESPGFLLNIIIHSCPMKQMHFYLIFSYLFSHFRLASPFWKPKSSALKTNKGTRKHPNICPVASLLHLL